MPIQPPQGQTQTQPPSNNMNVIGFKMEQKHNHFLNPLCKRLQPSQSQNSFKLCRQNENLPFIWRSINPGLMIKLLQSIWTSARTFPPQNTSRGSIILPSLTQRSSSINLLSLSKRQFLNWYNFVSPSCRLFILCEKKKRVKTSAPGLKLGFNSFTHLGSKAH